MINMISFLIPTHNREDYFKRVLNSLNNQTNKNFHVIVSNSSDNDYIFNSQLNIDYHYNPGFNVSQNYNFLLSTTFSEYYMILEDDDIILRNTFVDNLINILLKYSPDLLINNYITNLNFRNLYKFKDLNNVDQILLNTLTFYNYFKTDYQFSQIVFKNSYKTEINIYDYGYNIFLDEMYLLKLLSTNSCLKTYKSNIFSIVSMVHDSNHSWGNKNLYIYSLILYLKFLYDYNIKINSNIIDDNFKELNIDKPMVTLLTPMILDIHSKFQFDLKTIDWTNTKNNLMNRLSQVSYLWD